MNESASQRDEVERLAEEFLERRRRGERPTIAEYEKRHPELADEIRELFPAIAFVENMADSGELRPPKPAKLPGHIGDYRILREVGRGGMGVVYEAVQESLGRHVALKVLPHSALASTTYIERFRREARAAGQLHHTNIVPVFGVGEADGVHFYAMQYIQGQGLDTLLQTMQRQRGKAKTHAGADATAAGSSTRLAKNESSNRTHLSHSTNAEYYRSIARIGVQVADALAYAHDQRVLHRDIKPANLIIDARDTVWITDFGLAKSEEDAELTNTGDFVGTTRYMAPERFRGAGDPRSDVYSLGVTLYELLALRPAFAETDRARLMEQVLHSEPPPLRQLDRRIPRDLETIVLKSIAKEPRDRYATAGALAEDLRRFLADRPIIARRAPWTERMWRWCRRNPKLATVAGVAMAAIMVILVGSPLMTLRLWEQRLQTQRELWSAHLARAEAARSSPQAGRRFDALRALDAARELIPTLSPSEDQLAALRSHFIASLSLADLGAKPAWEGYPAGTAGVCFDHQLKRYARSDAKGNISIRRVVDDHEMARLDGDGHGAWTMHFSRDGRYLAAGYQVRFQRDALRFRIWDVDKREAIVSAPTRAGCGEVDFSPDGKYAAYMKAVGRMAIRDLDQPNAEEKELELPDLPKHVAYHPNGKKIAMALDRNVEVRDIESWKVLEQWQHPSEVIALAWRPDGEMLATGSGFRIFLWANGGKQPQAIILAHDSLVTELAFNHAGDLLVSKGHDGTVRLWDVNLRRQLVRTNSVYTGCSRMHFSPDDQQLGFASDGSRLWLWDVAHGRECRTFEVRQPANWRSADGEFSPDGRLLFVAGSDGIRIWDWSEGQQHPLIAQDKCYSALVSPDGRYLFGTSAEGLQRWPLGERGITGASTAVGEAKPLHSAAISGNGQRLISRVAPGAAICVDLQKPDQPPMQLEQRQLEYIAINSEGTLVATGPWYGDSVGVNVWDAATGEMLHNFPADMSATVAFSPISHRFVIGTEKEYRIYDSQSWAEVRRIEKFPEIRPGQVSWTGDESLMAIRHSPTHLRLVDPHTGRLIAELQSPGQRAIFWHRLSQDGHALAAGTAGGAVHVWNLQLIRKQLADRGMDW